MVSGRVVSLKWIILYREMPRTQVRKCYPVLLLKIDQMMN